MRNKSWVLIIFLLVVAASCSLIKKEDAELNNRIHKIAIDNGFSGSVLIAFRDSIIVDKAYGFTDKGGTTINTPNTIFPIASVTKLFIKHGILSLADKGKISLNDTLSHYNDYIMFSDKITIYDLLHHQSGLPDIHNIIDKYNHPHLLDKPINEYELFDTINSFHELDFPPGSNTAYSNSNYLILAKLIEKVSGQSLDEFLAVNIFIPFHLDNSGLYKEHSKLEGHAEGYLNRNGTRVYTPDFNFLNFWGSGNAYSTTHDLYNYYKYSKQLLKPIIRDQILQHTGLYPGYRTYYKAVPQIGLLIVVLSNNGNFNPDLFVNPVLSYFSTRIKSLKTEKVNTHIVGKYKASMFGNQIKVDIKYESGRYKYEGLDLIQLDESNFLIPNPGYTVLTFRKSAFKDYEMVLNDNGMLIRFEKDY